MKTIAILDGETLPFKHGRFPEDFLWGIYDGQNFYEFVDKDDVIKFLCHKDWIVYAHNGGKFDYHYFVDYVEPDSSVLIINGRLAKFKIGKCEFRDSYNLMPMPLSQYNKTEIDYSKFEKDKRLQYMDEIRAYLKDDCVFLYELVKRFIDDYGLNITLASSAMKYWKEHFYNGERFTNNNVSFYNRFSSYYYGGRVECFKTGPIDHPFSVYDINSAYPFAMTFKHAWGNDFIVMDTLPETGIEQCFIELECISNGALPYRKPDGSLYFPNDNEIRTYFISGWEYVAGIETESLHSVNVISVTQFNDEIDFTDYVNYFYEQKAALKPDGKGNGDKAGYIMAKFFLNSLYGKFGANPQKYKSYVTLEPKYIAACEKVEGKRFAGMLGQTALMAENLDDEEMHFYNVATAASITGFVRSILFRAICASNNVLYCDTDCIVCVSTSVKIGAEIGDWTREGDFARGGIAGKKLYVFDRGPGHYKKSEDRYKTASKGVKLTPKEILSICGGAEIEYCNDAPTFGFKKELTFIKRKIKMRS